jgi:hypothetical protein
MSQAVEVYSFNIAAGESIQLWIHGYDQHSFVGFDLKPELIVTGTENGNPIFTGEKLFLAYNVVGVGEHVDTTIGYTVLFTNQSEGADVQEVSGFLINLFEPIVNFP